MFKERKVIIFDMDGTLIGSVGVWNKTDEILISQLSGNQEVRVENVQQMRDSILAQCKSENIYLGYCDHLRKKYNYDMTAKDSLALRWQISNEYIEKQVDYKPNADVLLKLLKAKGSIENVV